MFYLNCHLLVSLTIYPCLTCTILNILNSHLDIQLPISWACCCQGLTLDWIYSGMWRLSGLICVWRLSGLICLCVEAEWTDMFVCGGRVGGDVWGLSWLRCEDAEIYRGLMDGYMWRLNGLGHVEAEYTDVYGGWIDEDTYRLSGYVEFGWTVICEGRTDWCV